jgi:simple sugar transport system permease protein
VNAIAVSLVAATLTQATPLAFTAMGGGISERSGVINVALEGIMLSGAFGYYVGAHWTGGSAAPLTGLAMALVVGMAVAAILAFISVRLGVDQVVVGIAVNIAALGVTGFLYRAFYNSNSHEVEGISTWRLPGLSRIPFLGETVFAQSPLTYVAVVSVVAVWWFLRHTRLGTWVRAIGEAPEAADVVGIKVNALRWFSVLAAGALAGLGGGFIVTQVLNFSEGMSSGLGFIALAAVIVGRWEPLGAAAACLLFGALESLQTTLQSAGIHAPYQLLLATPYVVTIVVLSLPFARARPPAAEGIAFLKS